MAEPEDKPQADKFVELAREREADEDETRFGETVNKVAKGPGPSDPAGRETDELKKQRAEKPDLDRFLTALDVWAESGVASVACDKCGSPISFRREGQTTWHDCECGKFRGVLRGL